jgi:hypothetical protein
MPTGSPLWDKPIDPLDAMKSQVEQLEQQISLLKTSITIAEHKKPRPEKVKIANRSVDVYNVGKDDLADHDLELLAEHNISWYVYAYEQDYYEGSGQGVAYSKKTKRIYLYDFSHCSCDGPMTTTKPTVYTPETWQINVNETATGPEIDQNVLTLANQLLGLDKFSG